MIPLLVAAMVQTGDPYAALALAIPSREWEAVQAYIDGAGSVPSFLPAGSTLLSVQRAVSQRWSTVLQALERASELPYTSGKTDTSQIVTLAQLTSTAARPRFAEGNRHDAVTLLLAGLTMAVRTHSADAERVILQSFAENLNGLPLAECSRVRAKVDDYLSATPSIGLRLLRAHMRIEAYRWQWLKLPSSLKDAMPAAETLDGMNGQPFRFEQTAGGYVLRTKPGKDGTSISLAGPILRDAQRS